MNIGIFDYSDESFTDVLGAEAMEQIRQSVAAARPPSPEQVERLRTIFAPAVARLIETREEVKAA